MCWRESTIKLVNLNSCIVIFGSFDLECCVTIECLQRGIKQICGLCKMVRRSLSARDARILLWKSDVKSAASDNSIGLMVAIVTKFAGYLYSEKACRSRMSIELL
ncbi:uncharacterized protein OCT59_026747 [Rhizophagus irregularis]|uniref:uncharacterized protein n=1 Tax=Rhizophagus irregularis TaxID=588596 RepID=UPI00332374F6|nr:hypothetical protein OCT59_026747 [Rhizophagus irregularis]